MKPLSPNDPDRIGPYRAVAELGRGAMGRVLLGAGPDGRLVAVKMIREWLVEDEEFRARFREEVRKSRQVSGPYTAAVVKAGPDDPVPWLASEFLRGPTLSRAVEAAGPLPEEAALRLAAGLAAALESIHEAGVIHRDLKPGNVILEANGPRVIDFGIARAAEGSDLTGTGALIGTPGFMSPEQTRSQPLTPASDVFSLGSVLAMACTGSSPFAAGSTLDVMNNVVRADPDLDAVPVRVRAIVERCLAPDPADRLSPAEILNRIGPVAPASRPWPGAVTALADEQDRELARLLDTAGGDRTLVDNGPTMVTDPDRPTWVARPPAAPGPASPADRPAPPPPPEINVPPAPPPVAPTTGPQSPVRAGAGVAAFLVCVAVIAALVWYADRDDAPDDDRATYVQECRDEGYAEAECETSWYNDASYTWTGELYGESEDAVQSDASDQRDAYILECEAAGHATADCETSWYQDPSYTWTGELFDGGSEGSGERDVYILECQEAGHDEADCETSWYSDPSYTWTGELYEPEDGSGSEREVYVLECQEAGHDEADCAASWYSDPSYTWTGELF